MTGLMTNLNPTIFELLPLQPLMGFIVNAEAQAQVFVNPSLEGLDLSSKK
jgi:hypothetical protein